MSSFVDTLQVGVPSELRDLRRWLMWKRKEKEGSAQFGKVPYYSDGTRRKGEQGCDADQAAMTDFDTAIALVENFDGVGIALLGDGYVALDFDKCVDNGNVKPWINELVEDTYAELSPSGSGVRAFFRGDLPEGLRDRKNHDAGVEIFTHKGFVTVTGNRITSNDIAPITEKVVAELRGRFPEAAANSSRTEVLEHAASFDATLRRLQELDMVVRDCGNGKFDVVCPFENEHTTPGGEADTAYFLPHFRGYIRGNFNCLHAHCKERPQSEFLEKLGVVPGNSVVDASARFEALSGAEFMALAKPLPWVVKGILVRYGINYLGGAPNIGKSALALDWGLHVAGGLSDWHGHAINQRQVVYIAQEGRQGLPLRARAWQQEHGIDVAELPFFVMKNFVDLMQDGQAFGEYLAENYFEPLVIIDTQAASLPGMQENEAGVMSTFLTGIRRDLVERCDASVLVVHHSPKQSPWDLRGSSAIKGAVDAVVMVGIDEGNTLHELRPNKLRDGQKADTMFYTPRGVALNNPDGTPMQDEFGDVETAVFLDWTSSSPGVDTEMLKLTSIVKSNPGISKNQLRDRMKIRAISTDALVARAVEEGLIRENKDGKRAIYYPREMT